MIFFCYCRTTATISITAVPNYTYQFQSSPTMLDGTWTTVNITADANGLLEYTLAAPESQGKQFYRYAYQTASP